MFYIWIQLVKGVEKSVKLAIQFLIGFTSYSAIMGSTTSEYCDANSLCSDTLLSVIAKIMFVVTAPPMLHVLLNSLVYGGGDAMRDKILSWGFNVEPDAPPMSPTLQLQVEPSSTGTHLTEAMQRREERHFLQSPYAFQLFRLRTQLGQFE